MRIVSRLRAFLQRAAWLTLLPCVAWTQTIDLPDTLAIEAPPQTSQLALDDSLVTQLLIDQASAGTATLSISAPGGELQLGPNLVTWTAEEPPGNVVASREEFVYLLHHGQTPVATARGPISKGPAYSTAGNHGTNVVRDDTGGIHVAWRDAGPSVMYRSGIQDPASGVITWNGPALDISDGTATSRSYVAMAASANAVHFAWRDGSDRVRYRRLMRNGVSWVFDPVRTTGAFGDSSDNGPDIAAFDDDEVHVLSRYMEYAYTRDGGLNWSAEDLNSRLPTGHIGIKYPALAVDHRGHVHMIVTTKFRDNYWTLWYMHRDRPAAGGPGAWLEEHNPFAAKPAWQDPGAGGPALLMDWADIEADDTGNLHIGWHGTFYSGAFGQDDAQYAMRDFGDDGDALAWQDPVALMRHPVGTFKYSFTPSLGFDGATDTVFAVIMMKALGQAPFDSYDDLDSGFRILRDGSGIDGAYLNSDGYIPLSDAATWPASTWWPTTAPRLYRHPTGQIWLDVLQSMDDLDPGEDFALIVHQRYDLTAILNSPVDSDGDGVPDAQDAFPQDPAEWTDTDADGVGNNADADDDNDGLTDAYELTVSGTDPETTTSFFIGPSPIPGDADQDGDVDITDLLKLQQILTPSTP